MRLICAAFIFLSIFCGAVAAQNQDSIFQDYDDYAAYVDRLIMNREFTELILRLGGRDEYTPEQLTATRTQMNNVWPRDFTDKAVFRQEDMGGGMKHEGRVYWIGESYLFFYALLHDRSDDLVVINFALNSSIKEIMSRF